jgi:hypothetical protein
VSGRDEMMVATGLSSPKAWHEMPGKWVGMTRPVGTCRTYPEGMTGLSPGFQPRVKCIVLSSLRDKSENPRRERCDPWGLALSNVKTIGRARRPTANRFHLSSNKHA